MNQATVSVEPIIEFRGDYRFLSNFFPARIVYLGVEYNSVENAYVSAKVRYSKIPSGLKEKLIHNTLPVLTSGQAKSVGRQLGTLELVWNRDRLHIMRSLVEQKFENEELYQMLRDTGTREIIEGNTWNDTFWGQCPIGNGSNHLGKILMSIRDDITRF